MVAEDPRQFSKVELKPSTKLKKDQVRVSWRHAILETDWPRMMCGKMVYSMGRKNRFNAPVDVVWKCDFALANDVEEHVLSHPSTLWSLVQDVGSQLQLKANGGQLSTDTRLAPSYASFYVLLLS